MVLRDSRDKSSKTRRERRINCTRKMAKNDTANWINGCTWSVAINVGCSYPLSSEQSSSE